MKTLKIIAALAMAAIVAGCVSNPVPLTMHGTPAETSFPQVAKSVADVPAKQFTSKYKIIIYPGVGANFNPKPRMTLEEYNAVLQLDNYCAEQASEMEGQLQEMIKQGATYGGFEGILGSIGYRLGFGSLIHPGDYLLAIGLTAAGGGLASGKTTFDMAVSVLQGYCMTGMVSKAGQLENKLVRLWVVPLYTGGAQLPGVSAKPAPTYPSARGKGVDSAILPP